MSRALGVLIASALIAVLAPGCGSSGSSSSSTGAPAAASGGSASSAGGAGGSGAGSSAGSGGGAGALSAEAKSAATGDIPDNQIYLAYHNSVAGYTIKYPEGWTRKGAGGDVTFSDKNNIIHVLIGKGGAPTSASVASELSRLKRSNPTLSFTAPGTSQLKSGPAVKAVYTTQSAPNPVTGKSVVLVVDRYELGSAGKRATVDLATAKGVDTVDAYRMIINSFHWQ